MVNNVIVDALELGLDLGDIVHNLRSALDHTVFALMKRHTRRERDAKVIEKHERAAQFPICDTPENFASACRRDLEGVSERAKTVIERLQPYHDLKRPLFASPLRMLREFSDVDKHRIVTPISSVPATLALLTNLPATFPAHGIIGIGPVEYGQGIGKVYFLEPPPRGVKVRLQGSTALALYQGLNLLGGVGSVLDGIREEVERSVRRMGRLLF